jgi:antitoxin HigA-1
MPMRNAPHPGGVVLRQCIEPLGLSITDAAAALSVTRTLSELVNEKRGISPEMAVRLSQVFGGDAESWLGSRRSMTLPMSARSTSNSTVWNRHDSGCLPCRTVHRLTEADVMAALDDPNPGNPMLCGRAHSALATFHYMKFYLTLSNVILLGTSQTDQW